MAISFVQSKSNVLSDVTITVTLSASPTNGNLLVGWFVCDPTGRTLTGPSGWTSLGTIVQSASGGLDCAMYYKVASGDAAAVVFSMSGGANNIAAFVCEYSPGGGTWSLLVEDGEAEASATTFTTPAVDPADGATAVTVCAAGVDVQTTASNRLINGSSSGVNTRETLAGFTGTGVTGAVWDKIESSTVSGSYTGAIDWGSANVGCSQIAVFQSATTTPKAAMMQHHALLTNGW